MPPSVCLNLAHYFDYSLFIHPTSPLFLLFLISFWFLVSMALTAPHITTLVLPPCHSPHNPHQTCQPSKQAVCTPLNQSHDSFPPLPFLKHLLSTIIQILLAFFLPYGSGTPFHVLIARGKAQGCDSSKRRLGRSFRHRLHGCKHKSEPLTCADVSSLFHGGWILSRFGVSPLVSPCREATRSIPFRHFGGGVQYSHFGCINRIGDICTCTTTASRFGNHMCYSGNFGCIWAQSTLSAVSFEPHLPTNRCCCSMKVPAFTCLRNSDKRFLRRSTLTAHRDKVV